MHAGGASDDKMDRRGGEGVIDAYPTAAKGGESVGLLPPAESSFGLFPTGSTMILSLFATQRLA